MKTKKAVKSLLPLFAVVALSLTVFLAIRTVSAAFSGAIFTSTFNSNVVNQNRYDTKPDVYLNGGPQSLNGPKLPDGTYYYQVTNPNGAVLLSTDLANCRQLKVVNGVVAGVTGSCTHANGFFNPANGSWPVQLIPFDDTPNNGEEYKVHLIRQTSSTSVALDGVHINFRQADSKTDNFKVKRQIICDPCDPDVARLSGLKFFDADADGLKQMNEPVLAGVKISITVGSNPPVFVTTGPDGAWSITIPNGSSYKVCEVLPITCPTDRAGSYWVQTAPAPDSLGEQCYSGTAQGAAISGLDFGDLCFVPPSGGYTLGFWSNKNGQAILKANDNYAGGLAFLRSLCLKDYNGNDFDPTNYNDFRNWLLNGNAVNMAYMLSVQLSATSLDVRYGSLSDNTIVDARTLGLGLVRIGALRNAANTELCNPGGNRTFTGSPLRDDEEVLKNALDAINNNRLFFASATPCGICYPL